jgi:hypothetical protein
MKRNWSKIQNKWVWQKGTREFSKNLKTLKTLRTNSRCNLRIKPQRFLYIFLHFFRLFFFSLSLEFTDRILLLSAILCFNQVRKTDALIRIIVFSFLCLHSRRRWSRKCLEYFRKAAHLHKAAHLSGTCPEGHYKNNLFNKIDKRISFIGKTIFLSEKLKRKIKNG